MFELGNILDSVCAVNFVEFYYMNQQIHIDSLSITHQQMHKLYTI